MPYTDFHNPVSPLSPREANALSRFAIILVMLLLLQMLLLGQNPLPAPTFAALEVLLSPPGDDPETGTSENAKQRGTALIVPAVSAGAITTDAVMTTASARVLAFSAVTSPRPLLFGEHVSRNATAPAASDLHTFSGARIRDVVQLTWRTVSETGLVGFEIERRSQRHGTWKRIGFVRTGCNRDAEDSYAFLDNLGGDGVMYYRLRRILSDGTTTVSPVVHVTPDEVLQSFEIWKHAMQPFRNYGTVSFGLTRDADVKLTVHDRYGNTVATLLDYRRTEAGHHIIPFGTERFAPGLYILRIHTDTQSRNLLFLNS